MRADKKFAELIFEDIGKRLKHEVESLLIGGNAMIYYGLKESTKDIDIVLFDRKDIAGISQIILHNHLYRGAKVLRELPYKINPDLLKKGRPHVVGNSDLPRFELFYKSVFSVDTSKMLENAKTSIRFDLLKLKLVNIEHFLFLKAVAARPVDHDDIKIVVKELNVDWDSLLQFIKDYHKVDNRPIWFSLGSFYDINKKETIIPKFFINEIEKLF